MTKSNKETVETPAAVAVPSDKKPVSSFAKDPAMHAAAESLHRWKLAAHHLSGEMKLSQKDYDAAIKAASKREKGTYVPHTPALFTIQKKGR